MPKKKKSSTTQHKEIGALGRRLTEKKEHKQNKMTAEKNFPKLMFHFSNYNNFCRM